MANKKIDTIEVIKPVFVIGTGRCGLTPAADLISYHPSFTWTSNWSNLYPPMSFKLAILGKIYELPLIGPALINRRRFPVHSESFRSWNKCFLGFSMPMQDLDMRDVTHTVRNKIQTLVKSHLYYHGKTRFLGEYSGWSRIGFFKEIFPDAKFIHIIRDGRAVANSLMNVEYWMGWRGPDNWRWGPLPEKYKQLWEKHNQSFTALAGIQWCYMLETTLKKARQIPQSDIIHVRFEDAIKQPKATAQRMLDFAELSWHKQIDRAHKRLNLVDTNAQGFRIKPWGQNLTDEQKEILSDVCGPLLNEFNYLENNQLQSAAINIQATQASA